ncbi:hypothetical protein ACTFIT_009698 [Dictyostelium discoideum]
MIIYYIIILFILINNNLGNEICSECGTAKCNYTNQVFNNCFCESGFKLSSSGKSCNIDQCFGTIAEKVCGSANCNYSFFSDWSLDSNSMVNDRLYICYCDNGYILIDNTINPYCLLINGSTSPNTTTTIIINNTSNNNNNNNNNHMNWTIPIVIIVSIFILLIIGSISLYLYKKYCSKPKRVHYQLIR